MSTDLSTLTIAAERWDGLAEEFHKQETAYRRDVHGISMGPTWSGLSADAANRTFDTTLKEFQNAQVEGKAIASLFRDAHTQFVGLHKKLKTARDEAIKAGMLVSDQGVVTYDYSKLTQSEHQALAHDPDYQESVRTAVASWQQRIDQCVKDVADADEGVEIAFNAVVIDSVATDGTTNGFNGKAQGDIEKYEADEAKDISTRIDSGKATAADYKELQRLFRDNSHDEAFSQTLLHDLGARGTLKLSNNLESLGHYDDKKNAGRYKDLGHGLATTLATATRDPDSAFYKQFREEMQKAGTEQFKVDGLSPIPDEKVRGYQSLVTLMQQGNGYNGQFLEDTADDIRHAETSYMAKGNTESVWALRDDFSGKDRGWFANDPLDGVLGIMSEDPKTSTEYLDPAHNDNLKYLLHGRDWDTVIDHYATPPGGTTLGMPVMAEDGDVRKGFGAALEAATTGEAPGSYHDVGRHTEPQARIMQNTINTLYDDKHADHLPAGLTKPLAHALTSYTPDTHETYAESSSKYDIGWDSQGSVWSDDKGAHMAVGHQRLAALMRGVADDPEAFGHLYGAEQQYTHHVLESIPPDASKTTINDRIVESSRAMGAYDGVRSDVIFDERFEKTQWAADFNHGIGTGFSTALLFNPVADITPVGDVTSKAIDVWAYESNKEHTAEANVEATTENAKTYDAGQRDVDRMVRAWGDSRGHGIDSDWTKSFVHVGQDQYAHGRDRTLDTLRADR
ncbi:hypothetical protein G3I40_40725 [Streptomyces sp. SID14478]|uniref:DUF6571 family protein n=1 Tax=Streptomyces sp. SID14478 TaxID=2706073 RepID=UPI0013DFFABC|nr:DUF6571 family protein [Streptomyces sp. SID14478]NEB81493.1 hypothetical protein [Streptomyces sp. SID14478]